MDVEDALKKKNATPQRLGDEHRKIKKYLPQGMRCYVVDFRIENRKSISFFFVLKFKKIEHEKEDRVVDFVRWRKGEDT